MYESVQISKRIKKTARMKKIVLKDMLETCGLAENTLSNMNSGRTPLSSNLAKIADYLGCSVDYLLGRTDNSEINK